MHIYKSDCSLYALAFKNTSETEDLTFAVGSCITDSNNLLKNKIEIVTLSSKQGIVKTNEIPIDYPLTQLQWAPMKFPCNRGFVAGSSNVIKIWNVNDHKTELSCQLTPQKESEET
jgi:hypothetical protein